MEEENLILVGKKPFGAYVQSIEHIFKKKMKKSAIIRARGLNIKKAIDLVEAAENKFLKEEGVFKRKIKTYTTSFIGERDGKQISVSCIDIELVRD